MSGKKKINKNQFLAKILMFMSILGPGLITANIDNDAGGIATYSLAGAHTGLRLIWIIIPITIALIIVQEMSARMGIVSGKGLADLIRERFGLKVTFYTLFFLIYADLGNTMAEFAGIASAGEIFGISKYITVPICGVFVLLLILKGDYKIVERVFLFGCLVYLSYIVSGFYISPDWKEITGALVTPNIKSIRPSDYAIIVGLIGTSIRVDEAVHAFEKLSEMIILAAEGETTMKKLLDEIESTKRRVNALEFKVIPNLEEIAKYISFRLEELERESIFGLKRIKG